MGDIVTDLLMHWSLDSDASDDSGNANHGTEVGSPSHVAGVNGNGVQINSGKSITGAVYSNFHDPITVSLWIKFSDFGSNSGYKFGDGAYLWPALSVNSSGAWSWDFDNGSINTIHNESSLSLDTWYHLVVSTSGGGFLCDAYVNNIAVVTGAELFDGSYWSDIGPLGIANDSASFIVDEVRIYERQLSSDDVNDLYNLDAPVINNRKPLGIEWANIAKINGVAVENIANTVGI